MNKNSKPFVSVIIPVYNDESGIEDTLRSLSKQDYPMHLFEVIVVDNNSTDNTLKKIKSLQRQLKCPIKIKLELQQSSYAARNKGIAAAKGDILVFIDSDMTVNADFLSKGVDEIEKNHVDYLGCRVDIYSRTLKPTICGSFNILTGFPIEKYMRTRGFAGGGNIFVKKGVFDKIGCFDERFSSAGDREFGNRVRDAGLKMLYCDKNTMYHPARSSFKSLLNKQFRIGIGAYQLYQFYPERYKNYRRNIFNPIHYFPILPNKIFQRINSKKQWTDYSSFEKMFFYLLACISKTATHLGYSYELLFQSKKII